MAIFKEVAEVFGCTALMAGLAGSAVVEYNAINTIGRASVWNAEMQSKLLDPVRNLAPGERFYPSVKVMAAGRTYADLLDMQAARTPVNVRNYPGTVFPNGKKTEIIGQIAQGAIIYDVILTEGSQPGSPNRGLWGAFECGRTQKIIPQDGQPSFKSGDGRVCTVYGDNLKAQ